MVAVEFCAEMSVTLSAPKKSRGPVMTQNANNTEMLQIPSAVGLLGETEMALLVEHLKYLLYRVWYRIMKRLP